ncbi:MAG: phosphoribosylaminoimidazolesuccinocarboxamide synthase [Chthonomonadales bacterium]|nr:phosphoribosylaminoimidazolesuccinocarboxamide synthase [Chthonomonadales bacterium]
MGVTITGLDIQGLPKLVSGKVREVFDLDEAVLIVATDRVSAYDSVMPTGIPHKGRVLTMLSEFWFRHLRPITVHHAITTDTAFIVEWIRRCGGHVSPDVAAALDGRSLLAVKADILPVECVVRGYLSGSLWAEYCAAGGPQKGATIHGIELPAGLQESDRLPEPLFTPATKATSGHDINIGMAEMAEIVGAEIADALSRLSIAIYRRAADIALARGIIIADTKFEFGYHNGVLVLADEVLTPDSSRFWDADAYAPGRGQASFDKQYLRDWLVASGWNKEPPAPELPDDIVAGTSERYLEAYRRITGQPLSR